jgi:2-keto-4-pentenoate hydratase
MFLVRTVFSQTPQDVCMPETPQEVIKIVRDQLAEAYRSRIPCDPVRPLLEPMGLDSAYAVQQLLLEDRLHAGQGIVGHKIGLTSISVQKQLGVDQPDYGVLTDAMEYGDQEEVPFFRLIQPKVEAEIAFILERDLDMDTISLAEVIRSIAYAVPAIEVVDSRIRDWKISIFDTIADNASSAAFVLGGVAKKIDQLDLRLCGMRLDNRGEAVSSGCGGACLGNPLNALTWLARKMVKLEQPLRAGQVILSGALGAMVPVTAGEVYEASISGLGSVTAVFSRE